MNVTVEKKETQLKVKDSKVMPEALTLYFETFKSAQLKTFILSSSDELVLKLKTSLEHTQTVRLGSAAIAEDSKGRAKFKPEERENVLNGESGKEKTNAIREFLNSFNSKEINNWIDSLQLNIEINLKRNLIWVEGNAEKISLNKEKKAARERARRIERGGTGKRGRRVGSKSK